MFRSILCLFVCLILVFGSVEAQNDTMITVTGKVLSAKDSSELATSILYEKLPYYDDMGIATASSTGDFSFLLVKDVTYNISIRKPNYVPLNQEVKMDDPDDDKTHTINFYLELDEEEELIRLNNVIFARGSDILQKQSYSELDGLIDQLKKNESIIQLEGHTDFAGNPQANMALSQARVEAVKKYITRGGINKNRVLTKAFGGTHPLSKDRTPDAMAKNRRVEVRIIRK